jgi:hypothetical protein
VGASAVGDTDRETLKGAEGEELLWACQLFKEGLSLVGGGSPSLGCAWALKDVAKAVG